MIREGEEIIGAIVGGSKCGKTTLGVALARALRRQHGLRCLVYDPIARVNWGAWCWSTKDLERFKRAVWNTQGCAVFWDESSDSIDKNSRADRAFFTRIRHEHKAFFLLCHDYTVMHPIMRGNLSDIYFFRQGPKRAAALAEEFGDADLIQTAALEKREWIHKRPFERITRSRPTLAELNNLTL